jgi:phosphoribosylformylglycinamidine synthase
MPVWKIEVAPSSPRSIQIDSTQGGAIELRESRLYFLRGKLTEDDTRRVVRELLCDPVAEHYAISPLSDHPAVEIVPKPGVMDPQAATAQVAIRELGVEIDEVRTGRRFEASATLDAAALQALAERQLANTLIETVQVCGLPDTRPIDDPFVATPTYQFKLRQVALCDLDDAGLTALSKSGHLALDAHEMRAIQSYYSALGREPTDVELETLAQTWSEHCVHKTLKSRVTYHGPGFPKRIALDRSLVDSSSIKLEYTNLLKDTIVRATQSLDRSWCLSVFEDNAGIIAFDDDWGVAFKVETHNHPSALEPYGGAATGIGGCIRDIMGCGLGARPVANTNVFCFGPPDLPIGRVPAGLFHPARSMREVVRGVRDYGNRMGIPTVNGAIAFDDRYLGNPLVFCGCVGMIPRNRIDKTTKPGDRIVVVGGRTGRDGIHGATFSSEEMTDTHSEVFAHAVQIGNAITEKKVLDILLQARDADGGPLYRCVTDCGAGGLSSAVGEMGAEVGARVELDRVPLKYDGLSYDEIWISEAQERMVLAVPPETLEALVDLCSSEDVEATDIGEFTGDGRLHLLFEDTTVCDLEMSFIHDGLPARTREATWKAPAGLTSNDERPELQTALLDKLAEPDIASKAWVIRQYDHEVQGGSVIKPLMGAGRGPTDGAVVRPLLDSDRAIALSCGLCPAVSSVDPYIMAIAAIDEAVRNNLCVGGDLERMAILDNFCWGGVSTASEMGSLVRAAQGCHDGAVAYGLPFISGKDSLNNVFNMRPEDARQMDWPERLAIPETLLISAMSVVRDLKQCRSSDLKRVGNTILYVQPSGHRLDQLASAAQAMSGLLRSVGGVSAVHDISDGGFFVAAAEMVIGGRCGMRIDHDIDGSGFEIKLGSYLVEIDPAAVVDFSSPDLNAEAVGQVIEPAELISSTGVAWSADALRAAWNQTFDW